MALQEPGNTNPQPYARLNYSDIRSLEHRVVKIADLAFTQSKQRAAFIDIFRRMLWFEWVENLDRPIDIDTGKVLPVGMPPLEPYPDEIIH